MVALLVVWSALVAVGRAQSSQHEPQTLLLRTGNPDSIPAQMLRAEIAAHMPSWELHQARAVRGASVAQQTADARPDLEIFDAVLWVDTHRYPERLILLMRADGKPHAIPLRRERTGWARWCARYLRIVTTRILHRADLHARGIRSRWHSRLPRNGWSLRTALFVSRRPRHPDNAFGDMLSRGFSLRLGYWLTRFMRMDFVAHIGGAGDTDLGPQGGVGMRLALVSATNLRMGGVLGVEALVVSDYEPQIGDRYGWVGLQVSALAEFGLDLGKRGAFTIHIGPTAVKAPDRNAVRGMLASFGIEIDLGSAE